jgi:2'-5' RNA ligase
VSRTTLLVPVPAAESATAGWWPEWQPPKARGIPAHVSVLFPFLRRTAIDAEELELVAQAAATVRAFEFSLTSVGRFPQTVYLRPEPATGFTALTHAVEERFPGVRAYGGVHPRHVPHVTVLTCHERELLDRAASEVTAALPIRARAAEVWLMTEREHGGWEHSETFPLAEA